jgi:hypothetical protein
MIEYTQLVAHLKRTGRLKLLPQILRELKTQVIRAERLAPSKETAKQNPALISGWRSLEGGVLTDNTGKRALLEIYKKVTS